MGQGSAASARTTGGLLLERERELASLRDAVAGAVEGRPGIVVIEGPAGVGKTRLLAEGRRVARDTGARVLTARGGELERELTFGVVRQLFERELIGPDAGSLRNAAGAAREVFDATATTVGDDAANDISFAILYGLYWLTVNLAADSPLVIAVDDLHWCDEPSLRYFAYVVRRLEGVGVTLMCTLRPRRGHPRRAQLDELADDPLAVSLHPGPLSVDAARQFVREHLDGEAHEAFSAACHTATGGNALLLTELLKTLHAEGVRSDAESVSAVAERGPRALSRAVLVRLARVPAEARRLALSAAVLGDGAELGLVADLAGLEPDAAAEAARALVAADVLSDRAGIAFVHPLLGAAVYEDIAAYERSLVHERAARLLHERGAAAGTIAVHLALAPARGEEWVCEVLHKAAQASLRVGAPTAAAGYLTRALAEPPPASRRRQVVLDLGRAEALIDGPSALEHLTQALELSDDALSRGTVALPLGRMLLWSGYGSDAVALIRREAAELEPGSDARLALEALALMAPLFGVADPIPVERLERRLPPGASGGAKMVAAFTARHWAFAGGPADECARLALAALDGGELIAAGVGAVSAILVLLLADHPEANAATEALEEDARVRGSLVSMAAISLWRGYALCRQGELDDAESSLRRGLECVRAWQGGMSGHVQHAAYLSAVLRERGDLLGARRALEAVKDRGDADDVNRCWLDSQVQLLLAEERFDEALLVAEDLERRFAFVAHPIDTPVRAHRAVALYHLGQREEGLALAKESLELARRWGAPGTVALALRVLGTLQREAGIERLQEAVELADDSLARLELAKALVALGSALRAARRPADARAPLRRALELATAFGAQALAAHARSELYAAGGRPRTTALTGPASLTPAERRVAERAAAGQPNRGIAEALFVTTKTVEVHLSNAYRKLGTSSRHELADKLEPSS